jgi:hypothetical protein
VKKPPENGEKLTSRIKIASLQFKISLAYSAYIVEAIGYGQIGFEASTETNQRHLLRYL